MVNSKKSQVVSAPADYRDRVATWNEEDAAREAEAEKAKKNRNFYMTFKEDGSTRETYWNYGTGAFGQYYLGSLRDIGIVSERDNHIGVYVRTNKREDNSISGEELAEAFNANISQLNKNLVKCVLEFMTIKEVGNLCKIGHKKFSEISFGTYRR